MKKNQELPTAVPPLERVKPESLFWVDLLRVLTILGVVVIHTSADVVTGWKTFPRDWWWAANIYDSLVRGCVPIFIMLSGALLLPKEESLPQFFRKRFNRILIPFIAWSLFYFLWKKWIFQPELSLSDALRQIAGNEVYFHLWFLYLIAGLYLVTPVFRVLAAQAPRRVLVYYLALWFCVSSVIPMIGKLDSYFFHTGFDFSVPVEAAQGFIGYFVLGFLIRVSRTAVFIRAAALLWAASFFVCLLGTWKISGHFDRSSLFLYDNMAPNVVLYTASFFLLMKHWGPVIEAKISPGRKNFLLALSKASFGIYLVHPVFINVFEKGLLGFFLRSDSPHPVFMIPLNTLVVYTLSFGVVYGIQKIPYLKSTV